MAASATSSLPPDLFDQTTLVSLASTVAILAVAYGTSVKVLPASTPGSHRFLFVWHAFDALIHFFLEGSFLYHCFFSWLPVSQVGDLAGFAPTPHNFLGYGSERVYGPQAAGDNPFAQLWMVYAKADKRWAGADLRISRLDGDPERSIQGIWRLFLGIVLISITQTVISLELLTVFGAGPLASYICYLLAKRDPKANIYMIVVATAELYGGFMTFCPEWLTGSIYLDTSNFMYLWVYLVFFNMLWVFIPFYAIYISSSDILDAFRVRAKTEGVKKNR